MAGGQLASLVGGGLQDNNTEFADTADEVTSTGALGVSAVGSVHLHVHYELIDLYPELFFLPIAMYRTSALPEPSLHIMPAHATSRDVNSLIVAVAMMLSLLISTILVVKGPTVELFAMFVFSAS